jgi:hypothetical protein
LFPALNDSIIVITSLVEKTISDKGMGIEIFPNPANDDVITIKPKYSSIDQSCLIYLYDSRGLLIDQRKLSGLSKDGYKYSIQGINSGIYLIKVEDSNHSYSKKLIINH